MMTNSRIISNLRAQPTLLRRLTPQRVARKLWRLFPRSDYVTYRSLKFPSRDMRNRMCGEAFKSDEFFLQSGIVEARRLVARLGYTPGAKMVDIGSGLGRLAVGMLWEFGDVPYLGLEVNREFTEWCQRRISIDHPSYRFVRVDVENERYNPGGTLRSKISLPIGDGDVDIVYMWGVFTNMGPDHVVNYAAEIGRILRPGGRAFLTAFVEPDVPDVSFNPEGYGPYVHDGSPLLVVRYNKSFLDSAFERASLAVDEFRHHGGGFPYQSEIYLSKH